jgi:HPt (histidine-containing phosphotransfer) domain-containing protein
MIRMLTSVVHVAAPMQPALPVPVLVDRPLDSQPVLDVDRVADLQVGLPPAIVVSLVDQCLDDMRKRMPGLRTALEQGEPREIEAHAHALAGMAATYGLAAVDRRMRRIILLAREGDIAAAVVASRGMEQDLATAAEAIRMHLRAMAA